jgi:hypothetical protein
MFQGRHMQRYSPMLFVRAATKLPTLPSRYRSTIGQKQRNNKFIKSRHCIWAFKHLVDWIPMLRLRPALA